ncbi:MAG: rod shape-determining protein, partial [Oscillospiraceae bacterium]|nr:rod shape-determining protein [Oscillospiraceae bacterium]
DVFDPDGSKTMVIKGRHLIHGLPETVTITDLDIKKAIEEPVQEIIAAIKSVLEITPPELVGDIKTNGIYLTGGGALLKGLDKLIEQETGVECHVAEDPMLCVAIGTGKAFKMLDKLLDGFESIKFYNV